MANVAVSRQACFALALLVWSTAAGVRAEDAPQPQQQPAATPSAQKAGGGGGRGANTPNSPAAIMNPMMPMSWWRSAATD